MAQMLTPMRAALHAFIDNLPSEAEITLITTGGQIRVRVPPTADRQKLHDGVGLFASDGGANAFVDTLLEYGARGRAATWQFDLEPVQTEWRIAAARRVSSAENIYRLAVTGTKEYAARVASHIEANHRLKTRRERRKGK